MVGPYKDLLRVALLVVDDAERALGALESCVDRDARLLVGALQDNIEMALGVVDQTARRVVQNERVPSDEKIVSIFEPHTDIIRKDRRDTLYGHKVFLTGGASGLILDCTIEAGNPADATLALPMLERQKALYGRPPRQAALDGGFASKDNLSAAKSRGIKDVCFAKKRGLTVERMCRSQWVYDRLRRFRAGVESVISWLKRALGFDRCPWKGRRSFGSYVWLTVVAANLKVLARAATQ